MMSFSNPETTQLIKVLCVISHKNSVETVKSLTSGTLMIAKIFKITDEETKTRAQQEIILTKKLSKYKRAVKFINFEEYTLNNQNFIAIYLKYYKGGNMQGLFQMLASKNTKLNTNIILKMIYDFVRMLESLERKSICHRDIKFENIFLGKNDKLYLGDFGDSKEICLSDMSKHTIRGTVNYFSPKIAKAYEDYLSGNGIEYVVHNPHKSDVFSLGLVALYIYNLNDAKYTKNQYLNNIRVELNKVNHPYLRPILDKMLEFDESIRPNFIELHEYLKKFSSLNFCAGCQVEMREIEFHCAKCLLGFHKKCLIKGTSCTMCKQSLSCRSCGENPVFYVKNCNESLCLRCHIQKSTNSFIKLLEFPTPLKDLNESDLKCRYCNAEYTRNDNINYCIHCSYNECIICSKQHYNYKNCIENLNLAKPKCKCGHEFIEYYEDLFDRCELCGMVCKLCQKTDIEVSHLVCVTTFELYKPIK